MNTQQKRGRFHRIRQVVGVFYDFGFGTWVRQLELQYLIPVHKRWMRFRSGGSEIACPIEESYERYAEELPVRFRLALERLGATYVKLGQMLSVRADLVGQPIADELRKLQDRVPPFLFAQVQETVESELGKPLNKLYTSFDRVPVGAASFAQVHRAVLPGGKVVAVKVLRPGLEELVREDMALLRWVAGLLEKHVPAARPYQPVRVIEEFVEWTTREMNLLHEGVNIEHFRKLYKDEEHIFIPDVQWSHTSRRVLTMEFSHGVHMDDFAQYRRLKCSRKKIAEIGTRLVYSQFFEFGFFHGDPHPGNFFVMPNNTVCLHDFGIVGRIDNKTRRELIGCFVDFIEHDAEGAIQHLLHMTHTDGRSDIEGFSRQVTAILEDWFYSPTAGERLSTAFYEIVISGASHGVMFPSNVVLLAKAIVTMEGMALMLDPKFEIAKELKPYLSRIMTLELRPEKFVKRGREVFLDAANLIDDLPQAVRNIMKLAAREEVSIKLDTRDFTEIKKEIDRQSDIRFLTLFLVADLLATAVLLHLEGVERIAGFPLASAGVAIGAVLMAIVLWKIHKGTA